MIDLYREFGLTIYKILGSLFVILLEDPIQIIDVRLCLRLRNGMLSRTGTNTAFVISIPLHRN